MLTILLTEDGRCYSTDGVYNAQGLGKMLTHRSRLEREKEAAAARRAAGLGTPSKSGDKPLPSYMRATAASIAMEKVTNTDKGCANLISLHTSTSV